MTTDLFQIKFWGVRGSIPVSGPEFDLYGGNTSCIEIRCGK
ncbi:MBL fold metallo-hydrolase, partial [Rhizobium johnstonii]